MTHNPVGRWLTKYLLFALTLFFIFTPLAIAQPAYDVPNPEQGDYSHPIELPKPIPAAYLFNCWGYAKLRYPSLPPTREIWDHLQSEPAEIVVMMYGVQHFAVVESYTDETITISETNYRAGYKTTRTLLRTDSSIRGYYSLTNINPNTINETTNPTLTDSHE